MTFESGRLLDAVGWKLLALLQEDGRRSFSELGRAVGLSAPAVAERVRRLEEAGIISGYRASVRLDRIGWTIRAFIRLSGIGSEAPQVAAVITAMPEVLECHRVTGEDSYILTVVARSTTHLEQLVDRLLPFGRVTTSLILSSPVPWRPAGPPPAE
ncbi:MAG TPA: Lrp/AsnC family transcriptional regulator [Chloroflexaceae bacterium]|nr:Lrp/AsnC family transcriptional regulator [Chloroflexaceae bacterium]